MKSLRIVSPMLIAIAALWTTPGLTAGAIAQGASPTQSDAPSAQAAPQRDKPKASDASDAAKNAKPRQGKADADDDDGGDTPDGKAKNPRAAKKKILHEEAKYRNQKARIDRLRELATEQNNQERLAALDKLEAKMDEVHQKKIRRAKARLSDEDYKTVAPHVTKAKGKGPDGKGPPGQLKKQEASSSNAAPTAKGPDDQGPPGQLKKEGADGKDTDKPAPDDSTADPSAKNKPDAAKGKGKPEFAGAKGKDSKSDNAKP
jgi:hypothetical protein